MLNITATRLSKPALLVFTCLLLLIVLSFSKVSVAKAAEQSKPTALVGGRLIDGFGHQPIANSVIPGKRRAHRKSRHCGYAACS